MRCLLTSGSPDHLNSNAAMRAWVATGLCEVIGDEAVSVVPLELAADECQRFCPSIILVFGSCLPDQSEFNGLRRYAVKRGAALVFWLHDDPYEFDSHVKWQHHADYVFSNDRWAVLHYDHPRVHHLPLAADVGAHWRPIAEHVERDLFFCGYAYPNRIRLLRELIDHCQGFELEVLGEAWPDDLTVCQNRRIDSQALCHAYAHSRATLNIGRDWNLANQRYALTSCTPGPRTFEAALAGAVQLVHYTQADILDVFADGEEICCFDEVTEVAEHLKAWQNDPARRRQIAANAQARALNHHLYRHRIESMLAVLNGH